MHFANGYLVLGRYRGAPVRVHWATPLGGLLISGFRFAPGAWLAFPFVILAHELGHAFLARRRRLRVVSVDVLPFGGVCRHEMGSPLDQSIVAWGGVLAQALILVPALVIAALVPLPPPFFADMLHALTVGNALVIAFNLLPIPPLDGAEAWKLFGRLRPRGAKRSRERRVPEWLGTEVADRVAKSALEQARDEALGRREAAPRGKDGTRS